jgi:transcriptional regulator with XRE-family HTH domain
MDQEPSYKLSDLVTRARKNSGLSMQNFSVLVGVTPNAIVQAENGQWERRLANERSSWSARKAIGAGRTLGRLVAACGEDPQKWCNRFELPFVPTINASAQAKLRGVFQTPITLENAESLVLILKGMSPRPITLGVMLDLLGLNKDAARE